MCALDRNGGAKLFMSPIFPHSTGRVDKVKVMVTELLRIGGGAEADGEEVVSGRVMQQQE